MVEMTIDSIRVSLMNYQRVVILKEKETERYLPIWIGPAEADAIAVRLQGVTVPRPLTHDLLSSTIGDLGTNVSSIVVNDLRNDTFYARIILELDGGELIYQVKEYVEKKLRGRIEQEYKMVSFLRGSTSYRLEVEKEWEEAGRRFIQALKADTNTVYELSYDDGKGEWLITKVHVDSRPSDALALAVRVEVPIYAEEVVLDQAGIYLDKETGKPVVGETEIGTGEGKGKGKGKDKGLSEEEIKKMSAFYDFINTLDMDDFDKRKS